MNAQEINSELSRLDQISQQTMYKYRVASSSGNVAEQDALCQLLSKLRAENAALTQQLRNINSPKNYSSTVPNNYFPDDKVSSSQDETRESPGKKSVRFDLREYCDTDKTSLLNKDSEASGKSLTYQSHPFFS
jgi:hypothetical protein